MKLDEISKYSEQTTTLEPKIKTKSPIVVERYLGTEYLVNTKVTWVYLFPFPAYC